MKRFCLLLLLAALMLAGCADPVSPGEPSSGAVDSGVSEASELPTEGAESPSAPVEEDPGPFAEATRITSAGSGYDTILRVKSTGQLVFTPYITELSKSGRALTNYRCFLRFTLLDEKGLPYHTYEPVEIAPRSAAVATAYDFFLQDAHMDCGFCPTAGRSYNVLLTVCSRDGTPVFYGEYPVTAPYSFESNQYYNPTAIPEKPSDETFTLHYAVLGEGGSLSGELVQTLRVGETASPVSALPDPDYRLLCWSDGLSVPTRQGDAISCDSWIYASFITDKIEDHGIPAICVNVNDGSGITDRSTWKDCAVTLTNCDEKFAFTDLAATVRGRGNGSWDQSATKKPMKIKFGKKQNLLEMGQGKAKDWVLIPNAVEYSLLRNFIALRMGQLLDGIDYSAGSRLVEVYLNGEYKGVYLLTEQTEVQKHRVNVDTTGEEEEIGYLVELDRYASGAGRFTINGEEYEVKSDWQTDAQLQGIIDKVTAVDAAIRRGERAAIEKLVDLDSLLDTYLLHEYLKNTDSGWSSFYFYADKGGKLTFGAPWDFDLSQGSDSRFRQGAWDGFDAGTGYDAGYDQDNEWFKALWKQDWFRTAAAKRWYEISDTIIPQVLSEAYALAESARTAIDANYELYGAPDGWRTYDDCLAELQSWHRNRKTWLDRNFRQYLA